jgi:hypothetical protein
MAPGSVPRCRRRWLGHQCGGPGRQAAGSQRANCPPRAGVRLLAVRPRHRTTETDARGRSLLCRSEQSTDRHPSTHAGSRAHPRRPGRPAYHRQPLERGDIAPAQPGLDVSGGAAGRVRAAAVAGLGRHRPPADGELRYCARRVADQRDRVAFDPIWHVCGDPTGVARAQRPQVTDAIEALGTSRRRPGAHPAGVGVGLEGLRAIPAQSC